MKKKLSILTLLILVVGLISGCSAVSKLFGGGDRATPAAASNENINALTNVSINNTKLKISQNTTNKNISNYINGSILNNTKLNISQNITNKATI